MRFLGIDYGEKKIGLAVSDENAKFAFPFAVLDNASAKYAINAIKKVVGKKEISRIILGQSLDFKGKPNPIMKRIGNFKKLLENELKIPIEYENEVLTTRQAGRKMARGRPDKRCCKPFDGKIHASAAALILQTYLDRQPR